MSNYTLFIDLREEKAYPIADYLEEHADMFDWYEMSIAEEIRESDNKRSLTVGDIAMTIDFNSGATGLQRNKPHRVLIIDILKDEEGNSIYRGFLMSSKIEKSNKNTEKYPNNIYIEDYSSIFSRARTSDHKPVFIRVDDIVEFSDADTAPTGVWKGHVSDEFMTFVHQAHENSRSNPDLNKKKFFIK